MDHSTNNFKILVLAGLALFLVSCGSKKDQSTNIDFSSRTPVDLTSTTKPIAYCNERKGPEISTRLKVFTDSNNTPQMEFVLARLTALPNNFKESKTYISMWKWLANSNGSSYIDNTPLQFVLINSSNGQALTNWKTTLRWSDVVATASAMNITDPQAFFQKVSILVDLKDAQGEYDVLKIANYDVATNKAVSQTDALLPLFYANPQDYAFEPTGEPRSHVLQELHPFKDRLNQGFTSEQFKSMSNDFCF